MRQHEIIIKPLVTEKANNLTEKRNIYSFHVDKRANKLEIRNAVASFYGVTVTEVNTIVVPAKNRVRYTTRGVMKGRKPGYKKALVTLKEGESIDLFSN
jgi:large subunit ribosomal protein L23